MIAQKPPYVFLSILDYSRDISVFHIYQTGNFMENRNVRSTRDLLGVFGHRKQTSLSTYLAV